MDIVPALSGMRIAIALAVDAIAARDHVKAQAAIGELSQRLADANLGALDMSEHLRKIEAELRDASTKLRAAEERLGKRDRYVLREVRVGAHAYAFEPTADDPTPGHYQCQICFDRGEDSILVQAIERHMLFCNIDRGHSIQMVAADWGAFTAALGRSRQR